MPIISTIGKTLLSLLRFLGFTKGIVFISQFLKYPIIELYFNRIIIEGYFYQLKRPTKKTLNSPIDIFDHYLSYMEILVCFKSLG